MSSSLDALLELTGASSAEELLAKEKLELGWEELISIPDSIGLLVNLTELGLIDTQLTSVPESIGQLTKLTQLYLRENELSSLPESFGQLTNLVQFDFNENHLSSLPESIGKLTNLTGIYLRGNELSSVPECIGQLTNLLFLNFWGNKLSYVPESIGKLTNLTMFALADNKLSSVPQSIGRLTKLTELFLCLNKLSSVPESIGQLTNLIEVFLEHNQLSSLPESIGQLSNLTFLCLANNPISELPESISRLRNLKWLHIADEGRVTIERAPVGITELPCYSNDAKRYNTHKETCAATLKKLKLYKYNNENFTDISSLVEKWKYCDRINISNNKISTLPDTLSTLTALREFDIANNTFTVFPAALLKMTWLTSLNVSGNSFTELPAGITALAKLAVFIIKDASGKVGIQRAPAKLSTLPCYDGNADLKKLTLYEPSATPVIPAPSLVQLPEDLQQYIVKTAPIYKKADKLGEGGQAAVYRGTYEGKPVAVKVISQDADSMRDAANEVILTKKIRHPHIVDILGVYIGPEGMLIVMELGSDSLKGLIDKKQGPLTSFEIVTFGKQIVDALNYCVTQNPEDPIHHRDLKTENVLVVNGYAKLADFGLAHTGKRSGNTTVLFRTKDGGGEQAGTPYWQGPEIYLSVCKTTADIDEHGENVGHRGEKSDVYAFGLILWSMATGKYPFTGKTPDQIPPLLLQGDRPEIPSDMHRTLSHLIRACWRQNYKLRPRFSNVVAVLSMCGAGNLDAVPKDVLQQLVPLRYSPIDEMHTGELYQYLMEQGVPQDLALKIRQKPMNGDSFTLYDVRKFMNTFSASEADAQKLVSLQKLASDSLPTPKTDSLPPQTPTSPLTISNGASATTASPPQPIMAAAPMQSQPSEHAIHPNPPKPIEEMNTEELVAYLTGKKGIPAEFLDQIVAEQVCGDDFLALTEKDLVSGNFKQTNYIARRIVKAIEELKKL